VGLLSVMVSMVVEGWFFLTVGADYIYLYPLMKKKK
jgi:hypothetical protein